MGPRAQGVAGCSAVSGAREHEFLLPTRRTQAVFLAPMALFPLAAWAGIALPALRAWDTMRLVVLLYSAVVIVAMPVLWRGRAGTPATRSWDQRASKWNHAAISGLAGLLLLEVLLAPAADRPGGLRFVGLLAASVVALDLVRHALHRHPRAANTQLFAAVVASTFVAAGAILRLSADPSMARLPDTMVWLCGTVYFGPVRRSQIGAWAAARD